MKKKRTRKKRAPASVTKPPAPEFVTVIFTERRAKYWTSVGVRHPGACESLPWEEALIFTERGDANEPDWTP